MALNSHQFLELYHAGFLGAGVINPLNLRLAPKELQFILADSGTKVVLHRRVVRRALRASTGSATQRRRARRDDRRGRRRRTTSPTRSCSRAGDAGRSRRARRGRPGRPHVHGRHDRPRRRACCSTTGPRCSTCTTSRWPSDFDRRRVYLHQTPMFHAASMGGMLGVPADRRHVGVRAAVRSGRGDGRDRAAPRRHDGDGADDDRACCSTTPSSGPSGSRALRDLIYGASPMPAALLERLLERVPRSRHVPGLRHDRVRRRC